MTSYRYIINLPYIITLFIFVEINYDPGQFGKDFKCPCFILILTNIFVFCRFFNNLINCFFLWLNNIFWSFDENCCNLIFRDSHNLSINFIPLFIHNSYIVSTYRDFTDFLEIILFVFIKINGNPI